MKVLSIDLDYIMSPSIQLYQGLIWDENPNSRWEYLYEFSDFKESHLVIDQASLLYCYDTFLKSLNNCSSVSFGYEHDSILYALQDKTDLEIINIDHHDDVISDEFKELENPNVPSQEVEYYTIENHDRVNEGNWVGWLNTQNKLKSYTWIHNENSVNLFQHNDFNVKVLGEKYKWHLRDKYEFEDYNFDHIFVCLSPQYTPKNHWHYFTMFLMAYEEFTGKKIDCDAFAKKKFEFELRHNQVTDEILHKRPNGG